MKKYILHMSILIFLIISIKCSSDETGYSPPSYDNNIGETAIIKIKEHRTNLPVPEARFTVYTCKEHDYELGYCTTEIVFSECITNNDGICDCTFPKNSFEKILIQSNNYWPKYYFGFGGDNEYVIHPKAWVTLNFTTDVEYPGASQFSITINSEVQNFPITTYIQAVNNSSKVLTLFGNEENRIDWKLFGTLNNSYQLLNSGTFNLNPERFENLTHTLHY